LTGAFSVPLRTAPYCPACASVGRPHTRQRHFIIHLSSFIIGGIAVERRLRMFTDVYGDGFFHSPHRYSRLTFVLMLRFLRNIPYRSVLPSLCFCSVARIRVSAISSFIFHHSSLARQRLSACKLLIRMINYTNFLLAAMPSMMIYNRYILRKYTYKPVKFKNLCAINCG